MRVRDQYSYRRLLRVVRSEVFYGTHKFTNPATRTLLRDYC